MSILLKSYDMTFNQIDESDLAITNFSNGYTIPLEIGNKGESLERAIETAVSNSPFLMPSGFKCTHMLGIFQREVYDKDELLEIINVSEFDKTEYGYSNFLLLGGCKIPSANFRKLEQELESSISNEDDEDDEEFMVKSIFRSKRMEDVDNQSNNITNKRQLRDLLDDDFFN